jgi:hypothetical protein
VENKLYDLKGYGKPLVSYGAFAPTLKTCDNPDHFEFANLTTEVMKQLKEVKRQA